MITSVQRKRNKEGKPWAVLQLEDWHGSVEAMVFSNVYEQVAAELKPDTAVLVRGAVLPEENAPPKISVRDLTPLEVARLDLPRLISIRVLVGQNSPERDAAAELTRLFERKRGETEVRLRLEKPRDFSVILDVQERVKPDKEFRAEIERICGPEAMEILAT
jgi:DNA polymerase-3 subunit alpha